MNVFRVLHSQVKKSLLEESRLSEDERRCFQWQFLASVGGVTYLVGKGGANTCFYRVGDTGEIQYCHPQPLLDIIKSWGGSEYAMYAVVKNKPGCGVAGPFPDLEEAKDYIPDDIKKGDKFYILGYTPESKSKRLFVLSSSLKGHSWKKFVSGDKSDKPKQKRSRRRKRRSKD